MEKKEWIAQNIYARKCIFFHPTNDLSDICFCGRERERHLNQDGFDVHCDWQSETHSTTQPTNVYGEVETLEDSNIKNIHYIRLADDTAGETVETLLTEVWGLDHPKIVISLISKSSCDLGDENTLRYFQSILGKLVKLCDVWYIADGATKDVTTKMLTDSFNENIWKEKFKSNALISFSSWAGLTRNRKKQFRSLEKKENCFQNYLEYTHLFYSDDGSKRVESGNKLKTTFEKYLLTTGTSKVTVPTVTLLIGGCWTALEEIHRNLSSHPRIPVLAFPYLGGLSEILAIAIELDAKLKHMRKSRKRLAFMLHMKATAHEIFDEHVTTNHKARFFSQLFYCVEECNDFIFVSEKIETLHEDLFRCLSGSCMQRTGNRDTYNRVNDNIHYYRLKLSILYEEFEEIDRWFSSTNSGLSKTNKKKAMMKALLADREFYVKKLLVEGGGKMFDDFSDVELMELYYKKSLNPDSLFYKFLSHAERRKIRKEEQIDLTIAYEILWKLVDQSCLRETMVLSMTQKILFWAVLNNSQSIALYLWEISMQDPLVTAVIIACAYKSMGKLKWFSNEVRKELKRNRNEFIQLALRLLTCLYRQNENNAKRIVLMPNALWEGRSILQIARRFKFRELIAHDCSQDIFNQFWKGKNIKKVLLTDEEESHRAWLELASKKLVRQGYETFQKRNKLDDLDDELSEQFEDVYINETMEERKHGTDERLKSKHNKIISSSHMKGVAKNNRVGDAPVQKDLGSSPTVWYSSDTNSSRDSGQGNKKVDFSHTVSISDDMNRNNISPTKVIDKSENNDDIEKKSLDDNLQDELKSMSLSTHSRQSSNTLYKQFGYNKTTKGRKLSQARKYGRVQLLWKAIKALFTVPRGKFILHVIIYLCFLGLFSHFLLERQNKSSIEEWILFVYVLATAVDEIYQVITIDRSSGHKRFHYYLHSYWNILDLLSIILFFTGFALRFFDNTKLSGLAVLAVAVVLWYVKLFQFYRMSSVLGPYIVMIWRMVRHLLSFLLVFIVVVTAYGVFQRSLLYMEVHASPAIVFQLFYKPFLLIFGEINVEDSLRNETTVFSTTKHSEAIEITVAVGFCVYMFVTNVLLINLLIAIFNNIYEDVKSNSDIIWKFERTEMIIEFIRKPCLPIPLSMLAVIWSIIKTIVGRYKSKLYTVHSLAGCGERMEFSNDVIKKLKLKQIKMTELFLLEKNRHSNHEEIASSSTDEKIIHVVNDLKDVISHLRRTQVHTVNQGLNQINNKNSAQIQDILDTIKRIGDGSKK